MSPPSSNDPQSPNGPREPTRRDRTVVEFDAVKPNDPHLRPQSAFGLPPVVTQPFAVFKAPDTQVSPAVTQPFAAFKAPNTQVSPAVTQPFAAFKAPDTQVPQSERATQPLPRRPASAPPPQSTPGLVSMARVHGVGGQVESRPISDPQRPLAPRAPESFGGTMIAAGHRTPPAMQPPRAPVPAYPSQVYDDLRRAYEELRSNAPMPGARDAETPREPNPQAQTTCIDVQELVEQYPVPLPEFRAGREDSSSAWSMPVAESRPHAPEAASEQNARVKRAVYKAQRALRSRQDVSADDDIDLPPVVGRSNAKWIVLSIAGLAAFGLLGFSIYGLRARSAVSELAIAAAPEAATEPAPLPGAPAVDEPEIAAPPAGEQEQPAPLHARSQEREDPPPMPARSQEAVAAEQSPSAANPTPGAVTASSAAALYINGQYKEALAEYQLLARAHSKQHVYAQLARILRRKLIETCMRTQPHRREQCKTM